MLLEALSYYLRNTLAARRTDNFFVQVETENDGHGKPIYTMERSAMLGEELLRELSEASPGRKACVEDAAKLTQSFARRYPGLASIRIQLGDNIVQSSGTGPTEVKVRKHQMPGICKLGVRNSGRRLLIKCNKAITRPSQILTVELGDRFGNWWECFQDEWSTKANPPKGLTVTVETDSLWSADYVVLQCVADNAEESVCLPAVAVIRPLSLRWWELRKAKTLKAICKEPPGSLLQSQLWTSKVAG